MENQQENLNQNETQDQAQSVDQASLATDGPVSQQEGDEGADLNETSTENDDEATSAEEVADDETLS
jgi:hypothetical protein